MDLFDWLSSGLACRPADWISPFLWLSFPRGTPILAGGIGVARVVIGAIFVFGFRFRAVFESVLLLVSRLGLMPCSAWSKKKSAGRPALGFSPNQ